MADWRDRIVHEFTPQVAKLTLVADPDGLLLEEGVLKAIRERGFDLIPFDDPVAFRYAYETRFRRKWDRGDHTDLVVVLRSASSNLKTLPYDLLQAGRQRAFSLGDLFPNLSYPVVAVLDLADLDALYQAQAQHSPGQLGDNATKDFILQHVFEIAPGAIRQPADLLRVLLRRHYRRLRLPRLLEERLIQILRLGDRFPTWPLEQIVSDREAFLAFLQERWPAFLDRLVQDEADRIGEHATEYSLKYQGPVDLPFEHDDIRIYVDNLFAEGLLAPVSHDGLDRLKAEWVRVGIRTDPEADRMRRLRRLLDTTSKSIPSPEARHTEWLTFAYLWAELTSVAVAIPHLPSETDDQLLQMRTAVDARFVSWVRERYAGLHNQPPAPPVMLHHVPRAMARWRTEHPGQRMALLIIDGLALDQWIAVREELQTQRPSYRLRENAVFAWIPTITSVSRQAAFAGRAPLYFPDSIHVTSREPNLWQQFWQDHGLNPRGIVYVKEGDGDFGAFHEASSDPNVEIVGGVVTTVDRIMHGMELGAAGMHNQVRQWVVEGKVTACLDSLLNHGFHVTLTSDHGNIHAQGLGRPMEGSIAEMRGERTRIYSDPSLRSVTKKRFPTSIEWPSIGLPEDFLALLAPGREAFVAKNVQVMAHGGACLEEVVVPLIEVALGEI